MRLSGWLALAALLRAALLVWGTYQDAHSPVKYTDVDYLVFSDAALCLARPASPTPTRATYRYTPLVALALVPNLLVHPLCGKLLFSLCDLVVGALLHALLVRRGATERYAGRAVAAAWLVNPIVANISTRGSSEALVGALVVSTLSLAERARWDAAAALFGVAVHVKIFPFLYGSSLVAALAASARGDAWRALRRMLRFGVVSFACFMGLNGALYLLFGQPFVQETFLYHLSRLDHRHNFSAYFYPFYLSASPSSPAPSSAWQHLARHPLAAFLPQLVLSLGLGALFGAQDLPFAWLVQTVAFVTFNKVCTSQYFLWYLWLLPAALPSLSFSPRRAILVGSVWALTQALWLSQAFRLEMLAEPRFREVWAAGIVFLVGQSWVLAEVLGAWTGRRRSGAGWAAAGTVERRGSEGREAE
ncbi:glycosyltransferase family 50 protein [Rhodotorula graminis WP1]|uniref:GPI mannosyltransferase 1 n=1 Tax=Rhodotorula graminis (strain WP1) TaxID=578459 RepID=A0A0P9GW28_RHOGW|nr:glycosyltransferase family 50 protein [Rhodotorula graminis WP1]KPV71633.1 glycosyltransferase family 50 protein [Rhodotorula graminis WP1]